ncbi:hypothetical protein GCM10029964_101720 [Kibdelosporangium lantanae]
MHSNDVPAEHPQRVDERVRDTFRMGRGRAVEGHPQATGYVSEVGHDVIYQGGVGHGTEAHGRIVVPVMYNFRVGAGSAERGH